MVELLMLIGLFVGALLMMYILCFVPWCTKATLSLLKWAGIVLLLPTMLILLVVAGGAIVAVLSGISSMTIVILLLLLILHKMDK